MSGGWTWNAPAGRAVTPADPPTSDMLPIIDFPPECLNASGRGIQLSAGGLIAGTLAAGGALEGMPASLAMAVGRHAPTRVPIFYFEAKIIDGSTPAAPAGSARAPLVPQHSQPEADFVDRGSDWGPGVSLGFNPPPEYDPHARHEAWHSHSFSYHGYNGAVRGWVRGNRARFGPPFTTGDIIGAGIDWVARAVFFTKHGRDFCRTGDTSWLTIDDGSGDPILLHPAVNLPSPGQSVSLNFGGQPFACDLRARMAAATEACRAGVVRAMVAGGGKEDGATSATVAALVRDYLAFSGAATTLSLLDAAWPPPPRPPPLSTSRLEASLASRSAARAFLAAGNVAAAATAAIAAPGVPSPASVLASPPAALYLACQATLERLRAGDLAGAVDLGRAALGPFIIKRRRYYGSSRTGRDRARASLDAANGLAPFLGLQSPLPGSEAVVPEAGGSDDAWTDRDLSACDMPSSDEDGMCEDDRRVEAEEDAKNAASGVEVDGIGAARAMARDVLALLAYDLSPPGGAGGQGPAVTVDSVAAAAAATAAAAPPPALARLLSQAQRSAAADALNAAVLAAIQDNDAGGPPKSEEAPPRLAWPVSRLESLLRTAAVAATAALETSPDAAPPTGPPFCLADCLPPRPPGGEEAGWEPIWGSVPAQQAPPTDARAEVEVTSGVVVAAAVDLRGVVSRRGKRKAAGG